MNKFYTLFFKPLFDRFLIILFIPILLLLFPLLSILVGFPVLFKQSRPGKNGIPFIIYKFRTMTDEKDESGNLISDAKRLTRFGSFLRRTSLDELPELFNVLKGEMSLVGPRPLLIDYLPLYSLEQARRHEVKPGITGWAQINGRNSLSWQEKFEMDVWYVDHVSFWLDIKILFLTIWKVLKREGINQEGYATAEKFKGNRPNGK